MTHTSPMLQEALQDSIQTTDSLSDSLLALTDLVGNQADAGQRSVAESWKVIGSHFFEGLLDITVNLIPKVHGYSLGLWCSPSLTST